MPKLSERVRATFKAALSLPGAAEVIPFSKGMLAGIAASMGAMHQEHESRLQQIEGRVRQERKVMRVVRDERGEIVASVTQLDLSEQGTTEMRGDDGLSQQDKTQSQLASMERRLSRHSEHLHNLENKLKALGRK